MQAGSPEASPSFPRPQPFAKPPHTGVSKKGLRTWEDQCGLGVAPGPGQWEKDSLCFLLLQLVEERGLSDQAAHDSASRLWREVWPGLLCWGLVQVEAL